MKNSIFFKNKYYFLTLFLVLVVFLLFNYFNYLEKINEEEFFLKRDVKRLNSEINLILKTHNIAADAVFNNILDQHNLKRIIYYGWEFESKRDDYRDYLKKELEPLYNYLKNNYIKQLQIYFKDGSSFLRMHRPKEYGDNLIKLRDSLKYVNKQQAKFVGFELGKFFNGYRYLYPLNYKQKHIGSVELSLSFQAVTDLLKENFGGSKILILRKDLIAERVAASEKLNYKSVSFLDNYSYDLEIYNSNLSKNKQEVDIEIIKKINSENKAIIQEKIKNEKSFVVYTRIGTNYYTGSFVSVGGANNRTKAYMISYQENTDLNFINQKFLNTIIISLMALILTIVLLTIVFSNNHRLRYLANKDQLTKINNRRFLTKVLIKEFERKKRSASTFSFIIFDIDYFKEINDNYGHNTGDRILKELSELISSNIRENDYFGRWGGEEFVIIAAGTELEAAKKLAEKLRSKIEKTNFINGDNVTVSFGLAEIIAGEDLDSLIKRADDALYQAKAKGRNRVESSSAAEL